MLLAHTAWELTPAGKTATEETWLTARERAMHQVRDELRTGFRLTDPLLAAWITDNPPRAHRGRARTD
ncbi:MAG TPA: hypothetical protein VIJ66_00315 [Solirubrobacteraceae bacterium]